MTNLKIYTHVTSITPVAFKVDRSKVSPLTERGGTITFTFSQDDTGKHVSEITHLGEDLSLSQALDYLQRTVAFIETIVPKHKAMLSSRTVSGSNNGIIEFSIIVEEIV